MYMVQPFNIRFGGHWHDSTRQQIFLIKNSTNSAIQQQSSAPKPNPSKIETIQPISKIF